MRHVLISIILFCSGCGNSVYLITETDPDFTPTKKDSFHLFVPEELTISEKKLFRTFRQILINGGMHLVESLDESDLVISFFQGSKMYESQMTIFLPFTSYTSGQVGGINYSESTTDVRPVKITSREFNYQITMMVMKRVVTDEVKYEPMWRGYFDMDAKEFDRNPICYLSRLIQFYGQQDRKEWVVWPHAIRCDDS